MAIVGELGIPCVFVGARRDSSLPEKDRWEGVPVVRVGRPFPLVNGTKPLTYALGVLSYWRAVYRVIRAERPALMHASDFEAAIPAIIAGRLHGIPVVYNIHDNLAVRYAVPGAIRVLLNVAEGLLVRASSTTLVPEPFRRDLLPSWARNGVHVVRNAPLDPGYSPPVQHASWTPRVLFAGWLDAGRGLRAMMALARTGQIQLVVAGEGDELIRQEVADTPNVEYLGFCTHGQVIEATRGCDYVAAFYDPARAINRYAASNKIAEALAVGRPVLTNTELLVAPGLLREGVAIALPYAQIHDIGSRMVAHFAAREDYMATSRRARALYEMEYHSTEVRRATVVALTSAGLGPWPSTTAPSPSPKS
jgi:glycosyltransferase involved in cell wall biosynthesis